MKFEGPRLGGHTVDGLSSPHNRAPLIGYTLAGRNLIPAMRVIRMKTASTTACVIANGGSDCVGAQRIESRNFHEALHDKNKNVQIERCDRSNHVDPAPCAYQVLFV